MLHTLSDLFQAQCIVKVCSTRRTNMRGTMEGGGRENKGLLSSIAGGTEEWNVKKSAPNSKFFTRFLKNPRIITSKILYSQCRHVSADFFGAFEVHQASYAGSQETQKQL